MKTHRMVFYTCLILLSTLVSTRGNRVQRNVRCSENEYRSGNHCCPNCPAGTFLKSDCTGPGHKSHCEECNDGTFTEHANALAKCLKCTQCRHDQQVVRHCTGTQDAECQCKAGRFCHPDEACEVCRKCLRCENGEETVRNCTSTTNTECKKVQSSQNPGSDYAPLAALPVIALVIFVGIVVFLCRRKKNTADSERPDGMKSESIYSHTFSECGEEETRRLSGTNVLSRQLVRTKSMAGVEEERKMLCESLNSSASNSQHSLTCLPSSISSTGFAAPSPAPRALHPPAPWRPDRRGEDRFPTLVAVKGEESLRACFGYFEDLSMDHYKRFFRFLGIGDNMIKGKEQLPYEDRIHELLNVWVEKKGRDASLNDLLRALLELDQKYTAETIQQKATEDGHYVCEGQENEMD